MALLYIMLRISTINSKIHDLGLTLYKGDGYFYFVHESKSLEDSCVMVYRVNDLTLEQWIQEAKERVVT